MRKLVLVLSCLAVAALAAWPGEPVNRKWQRAMLAAIDAFPQGGGYYTGGRPNDLFPRTTMQGLQAAFAMTLRDERPQFDPQLATPSFCSSATYAVLIKALLLWDTRSVISQQAWRNMKPRVGIVDELNPTGLFQDDGVGMWGRANANGPGLGVMVRELRAGYSFTAFRGALNDSVKETPSEPYLTDEQWNAHPIWRQAKSGDLMKIFWNRNESRGHDGGAIIGVDGVKGHLQEAGHSVTRGVHAHHPSRAFQQRAQHRPQQPQPVSLRPERSPTQHHGPNARGTGHRTVSRASGGAHFVRSMVSMSSGT